MRFWILFSVFLLLTRSVLADRPISDRQWASGAIKRHRIHGLVALPGRSEKDSRLQIAVVGYLVYSELIKKAEICDLKLAALTKKVNQLPSTRSEIEEKELAQESSELRTSAVALKPLLDEVTQLMKFPKAYSRELKQMGVNSQLMASSLRDISRRRNPLESMVLFNYR